MEVSSIGCPICREEILQVSLILFSLARAGQTSILRQSMQIDLMLDDKPSGRKVQELFRDHQSQEHSKAVDQSSLRWDREIKNKCSREMLKALAQQVSVCPTKRGKTWGSVSFSRNRKWMKVSGEPCKQIQCTKTLTCNFWIQRMQEDTEEWITKDLLLLIVFNKWEKVINLSNCKNSSL